MTTSRTRTSAVVLVILVLAASLPAGAHSSDWFTCMNPSPQTSGAAADWDCSVHAHWSDAPELVRISYPAGVVFNRDDSSASPDGYDDPEDELEVGQMTWQTNLSTDLNCAATDDFADGGTYAVTWEDTWREPASSPGGTKVAQYEWGGLLGGALHLYYFPASGMYVLDVELPTTLQCEDAPSNVDLDVFSHEANNSSNELVIKNPSTAGSHSVTAAVTLPSGVTHTDSATITTT